MLGNICLSEQDILQKTVVECPRKVNEKKGYPAGSQKNNNNNKFIQYYHFVQMLAIKMTISKTAKFKEMKI